MGMIAFPGGRSGLVLLLLFLLPIRVPGGQGVWTTSGPAADVRAIALDLENPLTVVAAGRRAGVAQDAVFTMRDSEAWTERADASNGVTITSLVSDPSNPATIYATGQVAGNPPAGALYVSRDSGATWSFLHLFENSLIWALAVDPGNPATLYAGGNVFSEAQGTYGAVGFRSTDSAVTWSPLPIPSSAASVNALAIDPKQHSRLYAGTSCGLFFSGDSGASWVGQFGSVAKGGCIPIAAVAISAVNTETVYVGWYQRFYAFFFEGGVSRTTDGGQSWSGNLHAPVFSIALDPRNPDVLFAGTILGFGVLGSLDGGMSWSQLGDALPGARGTIQLNPLTGIIYAATANGVFEYELTLTPPSLVPENRNAREVLPRR